MRLGTKTRYATRAMLELAEHYGLGMLTSREIADEQEFSAKYLEQLLGILRGASLVRSARGAQGGHSLARPPQEISLQEIYESIEGAKGLVPCHSDPAVCPRAPLCATREVWMRLHQACMQVLSSTTVADILARSRELREDASCAACTTPEVPAEADQGSAASWII